MSTATDRVNLRRAIVSIRGVIGSFIEEIILVPHGSHAERRREVRRTLNGYLKRVKLLGLVEGYSVKCDQVNNPPSVVKASGLKVEVVLKFHTGVVNVSYWWGPATD